MSTTPTFMTPVARWIGRLLDIIYPRNCQFCLIPLQDPEPGVICGACLAKAKRIVQPVCQRCALPFSGKLDPQVECGYCRDLKFHFSRAVAACRAEGIVRDCIHRYKYGGEMYYELHLAEWLVAGGREWIDWRHVDGIVPVPLHPVKERTREFNQAERLAHRLGQAVDCRVLTRSVRRVKATTTQTRLDAASRRANLKDAFAVRDGEAVTGRRLVLVDDVFTTGATLDSCARVLTQAGATDVIALTVARGV